MRFENIRKMKNEGILASILLLFAGCTLYDNYDMDLMQGVIANIESSSSYCDDEQCGTSSSSIKANNKSSSSQKIQSSSSAKSSSSTKTQSASSSSTKTQPTSASSSSNDKAKSSSSAVKATSSSVAPASSSVVSSSSSNKVSSSSIPSSSSKENSSSSIAPSSSATPDWDCGMKVTLHNVEYNTVLIKDVCVITENLQYEPKATANARSICYGNDESNCTKYGRLYNYGAATHACPSGWKLPTKTQLETMRKFTNEDNDIAGIYFKAKSGWDGANGNDRLGFNAIPGGSCEEDDTEESGYECLDQQKIGLWWTSTEEYVDSKTHYALELNAESDGFFIQGMDDNLYLSVRCVMK